MRNPNPTRSAPTRLLAAILTWALALGPVMQPVYAQTTALGDVPIAAKVAAKPNIVYTLDDSGSMGLTYLPDFVPAGNLPSVFGAKTTVNPAFCRGAVQVCTTAGTPASCTASTLGAPFYHLNSTSTYNVATTACGGGGAGFTTPFNFPAFYASEFNHLAYNPGVTYTPPMKADRTPLTSIATVTDAQGNQIDLTKVQTDPFNSPATTVDLTPYVTVPIYCNSDWPLLGTQPYDGFSNIPGPLNSAAGTPTIGDIGDAAGENPSLNSAYGKHCRINGTAYAASAISPAITDDYNYPWPKVGATINTVGVANHRDYFWRGSTLRQLWCDKTNSAWPSTCNGAWKCTMGGKYTAPLAQAQTCYLQSISTVCVSNPNVYTPAGCNTDPAYDLGGCVTGLEQVCLTCVVTNPCVATADRSFGACHLTANGGPPGTGGSGAACNCTGTGCTLPACGGFTPNPTAANCTKGVPTQNCNPNAGTCTDVLFDPVAGANVAKGTTLLQDSNLQNGGTGAVCRHNNFDYGAGAFPDTYPTGVWKTPISSGCPTFPNTASIPRHYYVVDSVDFCSTPNTTANAQWHGFGTSACQKKNDFSSHKHVKYGQFHRIDLVPGRNYPYTDIITGQAGTRTYAQEAINYGNWYAYYRSRILAAKTTSSIAFSFLDDSYRVGFHNLGTHDTSTAGGAVPLWVDVGDFKGTAAGTTRYDWYNALFGINITNYSTYTMNAMLRIGNLFESGGSAGVSTAGVNPLPAAASDPIQYSCQSNYHILFTDGFTNQPTLPTAAWISEKDATVPAAFPLAIPVVAPATQEHDMPNLQAILGQPWPKPFVQQTANIANTLADIGTYYWATDLRDAANTRSKNSLKNDVPAWSSPASDLCTLAQPCPPFVPADLDWTKDVAWWQHVNFSAISFGSEGTLDAANPNATVACIKAGVVSGVAGSPCQSSVLAWPNLTTPNSPVNPVANKGAAGVDDLWHATVNSRGTFVYAKSPVEVSYGLASILAGISNQRKARSGAAFNGQVLDANNNVIFQPTIEPGWAGDLIKIQIDHISGAPLAVPVNGVWWNASKELAKQIDPIATGKAEPWMDELNRRIVTLTGPAGPGVPFRDTSLTAAQLASLSPITLVQSQMIKYLRGGNKDGATVIEGTKPGQFRQRFGALGDLSNAQPVIVGPPNRGYDNTTNPGYTAFVGLKAARPTVVVAPANDGMVHVFDAGPMPPGAVSAGGGTELFAFIPRTLFRGVAGAAATEDVTGIQALTYQDGGVPIYHHHMYVDSSPRAADIDFDQFGAGGNTWHTIVVGGLGKGGNSYYALDLTDVSVPNEATAAAKVLWEWNNPDSDVPVGTRIDPATSSPGYTYGRPVIVKVRDSLYPYGRWVAIVTGGYNNLSKTGKVFFLDAKTGALVATVTTPADGAGRPIELAQIHAFVKDQQNQVAEQIYGGDLLGNVWRIDVSATNSYKTASPVLFAQLSDGVKGQPVTTAPQIEIDLNNGIDRYVFLGTGRLLHPDDLINPAVPQQQTFYAIRDGTLTSILTAGLPIQPRTTMKPVNADGLSAIVGGAPNGWYHDLPNDITDPTLGAQRIVIDPQATVNIAAYIGTKIQDDPCVISLPAFLYAKDYTTSKSLVKDSGGTVQPYLYFAGGGVGVQIVGRVQADGSLSLGAIVSGEIPGTTPVDIVNPVTGPGLRWTWRLLTGE